MSEKSCKATQPHVIRLCVSLRGQSQNRRQLRGSTSGAGISEPLLAKLHRQLSSSQTGRTTGQCNSLNNFIINICCSHAGNLTGKKQSSPTTKKNTTRWTAQPLILKPLNTLQKTSYAFLFPCLFPNNPEDLN